VIDLSAIDAVGPGGANDAFTFVGTGPFAGAGSLRFQLLAGKGITRVEGDIDGDGIADFRIDLTGQLTLTDTNFVL